MNSQTTQDWLQLRLHVMDLEAGLTTLAGQVAEGSATADRLRAQQQTVEATKKLCIAAFVRAFPKQRNDASAPPRASN